MEIHTTLPQFDRPTTVVLGMFDGVHIGHRQLFEEAVYFADQVDRAVVALTFDLTADRPEAKQNAKDIFPLDERLARLEAVGVDHVIILPFGAIKGLSPRAFVNEVLAKQLCAKEVVCGENFRFGRGAAGDAATLKSLATTAGMHANVVSTVLHDGKPISSTRIRVYLEQGEIQAANELLGRPYSVTGAVISGNQIGRTIDFPTINQAVQATLCLPRFGVYVARVRVDGKWHGGVANLGRKPTVNGTTPLLETHILGASGDFYGKKVTVQLLKFLRAEQKFDSIDALKTAISKDVAGAKTFFEKEDPWIT